MVALYSLYIAPCRMSGERASGERSRTLIVHKDDSGYGLTLSGDKPCRVQTVRGGGASDKAGVREGDVIIKVNGQQVTESLHSEVVKLIQLGESEDEAVL